MDVYLTLRAAPQLEKPDRPRSASAPPRVAPCLLPPVSGPQSDRETLQRCPATAARLSTFCPTRHWSMLWQVQWWAEIKHSKKKKQKTKCHDCTSNFSWPCLASLMLAALVFKLAYWQTENGEWVSILSSVFLYLQLSVSLRGIFLSGKCDSHDRLLPFGHGQKQTAGWVGGLIIPGRGYPIAETLKVLLQYGPTTRCKGVIHWFSIALL